MAVPIYSRCSDKGKRDRYTYSVEQVIGQTGKGAPDAFRGPPAKHAQSHGRRRRLRMSLAEVEDGFLAGRLVGLELIDDFGEGGFGVAKNHAGVFFEEEGILDAGETGA